MKNSEKKRLVIVGGGFAGLNLIKKINRKNWEIIVVDRNNYHSFPPLFYQLASGGLDAGSICFALRREMRSRHARGASYHMGDVVKIDTEQKYVETQFEKIPYDKLVIAAGTTNNFFGIDGLRDVVYTLKSIPEAIRCRNDIMARLERAAIETDAATRRRMLTFVIVGGGPTGVEIAGALGEMKRYVLNREYPTIQPEDFSVTLVEGNNRLLAAMSQKSSAQVLADLKQLMVDVRLGVTLKNYDGKVISFADGSEQEASMVIWTAGITGEKFSWIGTAPENAPGGRIPVDAYNAVKGMQDVYALGDIAWQPCDQYPKGHPQVAQVAIQGARNLAHNLNTHGAWKPFTYKDKGSMATVGRNRAVVDMKHLHMSGHLAWLAWMAVHLMSLLGMRNKITVFVTWTWAYYTYSASVRLLLRLTRYPLRYPRHSHYHPTFSDNTEQ